MLHYYSVVLSVLTYLSAFLGLILCLILSIRTRRLARLAWVAALLGYAAIWWTFWQTYQNFGTLPFQESQQVQTSANKYVSHSYSSASLFLVLFTIALFLLSRTHVKNENA